ncbi:PhzF family phenazine biosynthesis protein [Actinomycetes bacterium M1A6_2h]
MSIDVSVVRVFADRGGRFGNRLGIVDSRDILVKELRQELAHRLGFSETVFLEFPDGPAHSVHVDIFTPAVELPFAGHPTVGVAAWLAKRGTPVTILEVGAGDVLVRADGDTYNVRAKADWCPQFEFHRVDSTDAVLSARSTDFTSGHHYVWAWRDESAGSIRSRMFAPDMGVAEDEATGAAAVRITELLGRDLDITQGRGSRLTTTMAGDGWIELGGIVVGDPPLTLD